MKTNEDNIRNIVREMMKRDREMMKREKANQINRHLNSLKTGIFGAGVFFYGYVITKTPIMSSHSFISGFLMCGIIIFDIRLMNVMIKRDIK